MGCRVLNRAHTHSPSPHFFCSSIYPIHDAIPLTLHSPLGPTGTQKKRGSFDFDGKRATLLATPSLLPHSHSSFTMATKTVTLAELQQNATKESCYLVIDGKGPCAAPSRAQASADWHRRAVYNATSFIDEVCSS
jgi:hypothetical protein